LLSAAGGVAVLFYGNKESWQLSTENPVFGTDGDYREILTLLAILLLEIALASYLYRGYVYGVEQVSVKRTYPTPDSCLTHLFHGRGRS